MEGLKELYWQTLAASFAVDGAKTEWLHFLTALQSLSPLPKSQVSHNHFLCAIAEIKIKIHLGINRNEGIDFLGLEGIPMFCVRTPLIHSKMYRGFLYILFSDLFESLYKSSLCYPPSA